jgi:hypothetical protein
LIHNAIIVSDNKGCKMLPWPTGRLKKTFAQNIWSPARICIVNLWVGYGPPWWRVFSFVHWFYCPMTSMKIKCRDSNSVCVWGYSVLTSSCKQSGQCWVCCAPLNSLMSTVLESKPFWWALCMLRQISSFGA